MITFKPKVQIRPEHYNGVKGKSALQSHRLQEEITRNLRVNLNLTTPMVKTLEKIIIFSDVLTAAAKFLYQQKQVRRGELGVGHKRKTH